MPLLARLRKFVAAIVKQALPRQVATIVMFGDSLTAHGKWNKVLGRSDVLKAGFAGFTTSHLVWLVQTSVISQQPKICFIAGGINDLGVGIPIPRIQENVSGLIDTLRTHGIIPILTLVLYTADDEHRNEQVDVLNDTYRSIAQQKDIHVIDLNPVLSKDGFLRKEFTTDGIHLTEVAYPIWASEVRHVLTSKGI